jgi:uncharacterized cupredoxin-like copper-binding protein
MSNDLEQHPTMTAAGPRHRPRRRVAQALAAVGAVAVLAAGCGTASAKTSAPKAARSAASTGLAPKAGPAATSTITAKLTEFHIALSSMHLKEGTYSFHVVNAGHTVHALEINGPGVVDQATHDLNPGQSADLKITFKGGRYDFFCPVGDHKELGMNLELTVAAGGVKTAAATPKTATPKTATPKTATPTTAVPTTTAKSAGGSGY